ERIDHFETVRQRKHGSLIDISLTVSPVRNAEGKIVGASKIARDITEQKRDRQQIATLAREAEHRSKNLLANVQATVNLSQTDTPDRLKRRSTGVSRRLRMFTRCLLRPVGSAPSCRRSQGRNLRLMLRKTKRLSELKVHRSCQSTTP